MQTTGTRESPLNGPLLLGYRTLPMWIENVSNFGLTRVGVEGGDCNPPVLCKVGSYRGNFMQPKRPVESATFTTDPLKIRKKVGAKLFTLHKKMEHPAEITMG